MFDAFVLAAGLGTRLRPMTHHRPKALVPVCGVPLLSYALQACQSAGFQRVVVNAHWLAEQLRPWASDVGPLRVDVVEEMPDILGTGGGLRAVAADLAPRFVVLNADVLHTVDLGALLAAVPEGGAAMALHPHPQASTYGIVASDETGTVVDLVGKAISAPRGTTVTDTFFTGIHAMDRAALANIPRGFSSIIDAAYVPLVRQRRVSAVRYNGLWLDTGNPALYLSANMYVLERGIAGHDLVPHSRAAYAVDGSGREWGDADVVRGIDVDGPVWVGHDVRFGRGTRLSHAIVGDGARVAADADLGRSVVWDGARVGSGRHRGAVIT